MGRWTGGLTAMLLGLWAAAPASGADTVIDFESPGPETTITNQYADVGGPGQGVVFGPLPSGAGDGHRPIIKAPGAGQTSSGAQVADISYSPGCEGCIPGTTGTFSVVRSKVSVHVGFPGEASPACTPATATQVHCVEVTLRAYDAAGVEVAASSPALLTRGAGMGTVLTVQTASRQIAGFRISARDTDHYRVVAIDDLAFDIPEAPAPPDFALTPGTTAPVVRQGQTVTDTIAISRFSGSSGDVQFTLNGALPDGVHATLAPNPAGGTSTTLTITADPGAQPTGDDPVTFTVTGAPSSSAVGSASRTVAFSLRVRQAFDIRRQGPETVDLAACNVSIPFAVTRDFSLPGPVSLTVTGGTSEFFTRMVPEQATFAGGAAGERVELKVFARATGERIRPTVLTVHATAPPLAERTATVTVSGTCPAQYDAQVTSLQITQGTQSRFLPARDGVHAAVISYADIPNAALLRRHGPTVVRAYANNNWGPAEGVPRVPMVLAGYRKDRNGTPHPLPGSPLLPNGGPRTLKNGAIDPTVPQMEADDGAYTFTLPPAWTAGTIGISAQLQPALPPPEPVLSVERQVGVAERAVTPCTTQACRLNDYFAISGIPFHATPGLTIRPLDMRRNGVPSPPPEKVFEMTRVVTPLPVQVLPYQAVIDISDIASSAKNADQRNSAVTDRVHDWVCDNGNFAIGVNPGQVARGLYRSGAWCWSQLDTINSATVAHENPLGSVAHEWYHALGRLHASPGCGGGANGERNEPWPPDEQGFLQSVGLDTRLGSGSNGAPYDVIPGSPAVWFDLMSYCMGTTGLGWISVHNWNAVMRDRAYLRAAPASVRQTGPRSPSLIVNAAVTPAGEASILSVTPLAAPAQPASPSSFRLVAYDASGAQLADVAMLETSDHVDHQAPLVALTAAVPAAGVARVAVVRDGATLATQERSPGAPTVTTPQVTVTRRTAAVAWKAADPDGDALIAAVDYSVDGGRSYRRIFRGPNRGRARLPARLLSRTPRARVRVTVNDGFRQATALSGIFRSAGGPPVARIVSPRPGVRQPNDATLVLSGEAFDDTGRALAGERLRWRVGRRLLGTGRQIAVAGLPAGAHRVVLVARDRFGRTGRASVPLRLSAARPLFLALSAPKRVARTARSLRVRVSTSLRGRLVVRGRGLRPQRFAVGRAARRVRVRIPPGRAKLTLRLTLQAGGLSRPATLTVTRR